VIYRWIVVLNLSVAVKLPEERRRGDFQCNIGEFQSYIGEFFFQDVSMPPCRQTLSKLRISDKIIIGRKQKWKKYFVVNGDCNKKIVFKE
jgi:hypothetical protein